MRTLTIEGVIGRKGDSAIGKGEKSFSLADLEAFIDSNGSEPFDVVIKSPGGSVEEGFRIYDKLKSLGVNTTAITANSIASVIFLAGKVRKVTPSTEMIIHNAWVDGETLSGEKLNFHTLSALTEIFAETDMKILNVYSEVAGPGKASKLLALMAEETNIGADTALELGFATEKITDEIKAHAFKNRVLTYCKNQTDLLENSTKQLIEKEEMDNKEKVNAFEKMLAGIKNLFKVSLRNMAVATKEGVALFIAGAEDGELLGKVAYLALEGLPTEEFAPAGSHVLEDGTTITVGEAGVITEVIAAEAPVEVEDVAALKAAFDEEKTAMLAAFDEKEKALTAKIANLTKGNSEAQTKLNALVVDFEKLRNEIVGDPDKKKVDKVLSAEEFAKLSPGEKIKARAMAKAVK